MPQYANSIATTFPNKVVTQSPEKAYQTFVDIYNRPPPPAITNKDISTLANTDDLTYDVSMLWATEHCFMHVRHAKQLKLLDSMKSLLDGDESFALLASAVITMQRLEHHTRSFDDAAAKAEMKVLLQHPVINALNIYLLEQPPNKIEAFVKKIEKLDTVGLEEVLQAGATDCGEFRTEGDCPPKDCEWKRNKCEDRRERLKDTKVRFDYRKISFTILACLFFILVVINHNSQEQPFDIWNWRTYLGTPQKNITQSVIDTVKYPITWMNKTIDLSKWASKTLVRTAAVPLSAYIGSWIAGTKVGIAAAGFLGVTAGPFTAGAIILGSIFGYSITGPIFNALDITMGGLGVQFMAYATISKHIYYNFLVWLGDWCRDYVAIKHKNPRTIRSIREKSIFDLDPEELGHTIVDISGVLAKIVAHNSSVTQHMFYGIFMGLNLLHALLGFKWISFAMNLLKNVLENLGSVGSKALAYVSEGPTQETIQSLDVPAPNATPTYIIVDCTNPADGKKKLLKNDCTSRTGCTWVLEKVRGKKRQGKCKKEDGVGDFIENPEYAAAPAPVANPDTTQSRSNPVAAAADNKSAGAVAASEDFV